MISKLDPSSVLNAAAFFSFSAAFEIRKIFPTTLPVACARTNQLSNLKVRSVLPFRVVRGRAAYLLMAVDLPGGPTAGPNPARFTPNLPTKEVSPPGPGAGTGGPAFLPPCSCSDEDLDLQTCHYFSYIHTTNNGAPAPFIVHIARARLRIVPRAMPLP